MSEYNDKYRQRVRVPYKRPNMSFQLWYYGEKGPEWITLSAKNIIGRELTTEFLEWKQKYHPNVNTTRPNHPLHELIAFVMEIYYPLMGANIKSISNMKQRETMCFTLYKQIMKRIHCNSVLCVDETDAFHGPLEKEGVVNIIGSVYLLFID